MNRPRLIILTGNIGSGKTTTVKEYASEGYHVVCRDDFRTMLGGGNYKFNVTTERAIHLASRALIEGLMDEQLDIIVDETNVTKASRKSLIQLGKLYGYLITGIVMPRLPKATSLRNREKDDLRGSGLFVWSMVWDKFDKQYEEPSLDEGFNSLMWKDRQ